MYVITLLQGMIFYSAVATLYRQAAGITIFQIAVMESISYALQLILELPWGILADRLGYKNTMVVCNVLFFLSKIVFWRADSFGMFLLERVLLSIVFAGISGVDESIVYLSCHEDYAHKAFGIIEGAGTAGMLAASAIYSIFINGRYRLAGFLTVISYGIAMVLTFFLKEVKRMESTKEKPWKEFSKILKDTVRRKELLLFLIGGAIISEIHQTVTVFLNQLQYIRSGMSESMIGWAYVMVTIAGLISVKSDKVTRRFGKRKSGTVYYMLAVLSCMVMIVTRNPWISMGAVLMLRMTFSLMMPMFRVIQNQQIVHNNRATALSIHSLLMDGVSIGANLVFGKASDCNLSMAFGIGAGLGLVGLGLFLYSTHKMNIRE